MNKSSIAFCFVHRVRDASVGRRAVSLAWLAAPLLACGPGSFPDLLSHGHFGDPTDTTETGGDGDGDGDGGPGDGDGDGDGGPGDGDGDGDGSCFDGTLSSSVPQSIVGTTVGAGDDLEAGCGSEGAPEVAYRFIAPYDGNFRFDTFGSSYDTVLALWNGECDGILDCNDDTDEGTDSMLWRWMAAGESVVIDIDGYWDDSGEFRLNIEAEGQPPGDCPDINLGALYPPWSLDLAPGAESNDFASWCGGEWGSDQSFLWHVPVSGYYTIEAMAQDFDPIVSLYWGCWGDEMACDDDSGSGDDARLSTYLDAGTEWLIVVDSDAGLAGNYTLAVTLDEPEPAVWIEDFESGPPLEWPWQSDGNDPWSHDGSFEGSSWALRSGSIGDEGYSFAYVYVDYTQAGTLSFEFLTSSEPDFDYLRFYVDGEVAGEWSGDMGGSSWIEVPVDVGVHEFMWSYEKDGSVAAFADAVWIDNVVAFGGMPW